MSNFDFNKQYYLKFGENEIALGNFIMANDTQSSVVASHTQGFDDVLISSLSYTPSIITHRWSAMQRDEAIWSSGKINGTDWEIVLFAGVAQYYDNVYGLFPYYFECVKASVPLGTPRNDVTNYPWFVLPKAVGSLPITYINSSSNPLTTGLTFNLTFAIKIGIDILRDSISMPWADFAEQTATGQEPQAINNLKNRWNSYYDAHNYFLTYNPVTGGSRDDFNTFVNDITPTIYQHTNYPAGGNPSTPDNPNAGQISTPNNPDGLGTFDNTSDNVSLDTESRVSLAVNGKLLECFSIGSHDLQKLNEYLWSTDFADIVSKYILGDPLKCIVGLMSLPFELPLGVQGSAYPIYILAQDTGARGVRLVSMIASIDCGSISIDRYWWSYLDYNTKIQIYIPYCGMYDLDINDVMGGVVQLIYKVDLLTGSCVANLIVTRGEGQAPLYTFTGNMGMEYPLSGADRSRIVSAAMTGLSVPAPPSISNITTAIQATAPSVSHSGAYSGNTGSLAPQTPFLMITRQIQSYPDNYLDYKGMPSNITETIGNLRGFCKISDIHLNINCLDSEYQEIMELLKKGIYIN